jgi:hypothetical protein
VYQHFGEQNQAVLVHANSQFSSKQTVTWFILKVIERFSPSRQFSTRVKDDREGQADTGTASHSICTLSCKCVFRFVSSFSSASSKRKISDAHAMFLSLLSLLRLNILNIYFG